MIDTLKELRYRLNVLGEERRETEEYLWALESAVEEEHNDHGHGGLFAWCDRPACKVTNGR